MEYYFEFTDENDCVEVEDQPEVIEAFWVDVTKPGQVTCGGNPVYACDNCGGFYGSHELFPSAKFCNKCGVLMKGVRF